MGKRHCENCRRRESELAEQRLMESWLCIFSVDAFCPFSKVAKEKRLGSVCLDCKNYRKAMQEMEEEDEEVMAAIDEARRNLEEQGY